VRARAALAASIVIGAVVFAILDEMGAKAFPVIAFHPQTITPLDEMRAPENIPVIGAPPDEHIWLRADTIQSIIDQDSRHTVHIDNFTWFDRLGAMKNGSGAFLYT
jgi:hypothetical protein